jgi:hypothetical protein
MKLTLMVVFGVIGLVMLVYGAYELFVERRLMANAQAVQATITESNVSVSRDLASDGNSGASAFSYAPVVKFRYEFSGRAYEGTMLRPTGRVYNSQAAAANELTRFPAGAGVQAFVNPAYPENAYLLREASRGPVIFVVVGALVLVIGGAVYRFKKF